jgi:hypothetical protein
MHSTRQKKCAELQELIRSSAPSGALQPGPEDYAHRFQIVGEGTYSTLSRETTAGEALIKNAAEPIYELYNKFLTLRLLEAFDVHAGNCRLPSSIANLYERDLFRIESQMEQLPSNFYRLSNDAFLKDLAILSHKLIPVGAEYVTLDSGVPRSLLLKRGYAQFQKGIIACIFQAGGFKPFFELHAHILSLDDFNPSGWQATYVRLAELLELNPQYRGITSSSWFLDPALEKISPHLAYLRAVPEENGATLLFSAVDRLGKSGALAKSRSRQRLYHAGQYIPAIYTRIWPRKRLIAWKNTRKEIEPK